MDRTHELHPEQASPDQLPATVTPTFAPVEVGYRAYGWTPERQRQFIEELADCGIVREAAARVGMTEQSAYRLRRRPDAASFNEAWDAAVLLGMDRLHSTAFERAVNGTVRYRYYHGEVVGEERLYDNRLLVYLLGRLDKKDRYKVRNTIENWDTVLGALEAGLSAPLPAPDQANAPVWSKEGRWFTRLPPPEGFDGDQWGTFGDARYVRCLTDEERSIVESWQARRHAQARRKREGYFARLSRNFFDPMQA